MAQELHARIAQESLTQADLSRKLKVSRARVTQVMNLMNLDPKVVATILALGDPLPRQVITERALRPLKDLPVEEQKLRAAQLVRQAKSICSKIEATEKATASALQT